MIKVVAVSLPCEARDNSRVIGVMVSGTLGETGIRLSAGTN